MSDTASLLHGENLSIAAFLKRPVHWKNSVLGGLCFSAEAGASALLQANLETPCLWVPMRRLDGADSVCEIWHGGANAGQGRCGAIHYRHDDEVLFGVIELPESAFAADAGQTPLQQATESAYRQILGLIDTLHFPYLFRFWNYMADINGQGDGLERYRQFNLGRQSAFLAHGRDVVLGNVPAACALGFSQGPLVIAFLAGRAAPRAIENPRQISAGQYPRQYGPRSPTFARANLVRLNQSEVLFVSGTASIVGHATLHPGDVVAQTRETLNNIETVLAEANRVACQARFSLADLLCKVYVRHPADLGRIQAELALRVGGSLRAVYLQADVCRQDLLIEIEASAEHPLPSLSGARD
ncbi:MAG: chorismate transformation enzyme, FkbO/Hyg5 family [Polaromonas sp.]